MHNTTLSTYEDQYRDQILLQLGELHQAAHACEHCGKDFAMKKYLTRHIRRMHSGVQQGEEKKAEGGYESDSVSLSSSRCSEDLEEKKNVQKKFGSEWYNR